MGPHSSRGKDKNPGQGNNQGGNGKNDGNSGKPPRPPPDSQSPGQPSDPPPKSPPNQGAPAQPPDAIPFSQSQPAPSQPAPTNPAPPQPATPQTAPSQPTSLVSNQPSAISSPSTAPIMISTLPTATDFSSNTDQIVPSGASSPNAKTLEEVSSSSSSPVSSQSISGVPSGASSSSSYQSNGASHETGSISPTSASTSNNGSSIPSPMASTSTANHNRSIIAAIVIPILFLFVLSMLGSIYFIRRRRRRADASHLRSTDSGLEESWDEMKFAGRTEGSPAMSGGGAIMTGSIPMAEPSLPNPFSSPPASPSQDSMRQTNHSGSLDYTSSQTSRDVETPHTLTDGYWTPFSPVPSLGSQSPDVPFFYRLRAMRRLGDFNKQPTLAATQYNAGHTDEPAPAGPKDTGLDHDRYSQRSYDSDEVKTVYAI